MEKQALLQEFQERFGRREDECRVFFTPGRVNLIGEYTDFNGGHVFPASLSVGTWAVARPRQDGIYHFQSTNFDLTVQTEVKSIVYKKEDDWANYPKGVLVELLKLAGEEAARYTGADILFHGNIPNGAGLSSSASIEVLTGMALSKLAGFPIDNIELAKLAQRAENKFVGVNCGIMDQFAVAMGKANHAIMLKCDTLDYQYVPVELDGYTIVITNTNKRRGLADSKYNERRAECESGLAILQQSMPGIETLGDISYENWQKYKDTIKDEVVQRRVDHVISENTRVLNATDALKKYDIALFGKLMKQSHESLRELFEVTGKELDVLYEEACKVEGCIGTRMTGAGFGGCNVSVVKNEAVASFKEEVAQHYEDRTGLVPEFYLCDIGDGAKEL